MSKTNGSSRMNLHGYVDSVRLLHDQSPQITDIQSCDNNVRIIDNDQHRISKKAAVMVASLEGSKFTDGRPLISVRKQSVDINHQLIVKQMNSHVLMLNSGQKIDLSRSKIINGSVPKNTQQMHSYHQGLVQQTIDCANNLDMQSNNDKSSNFGGSQRSYYQRAGSVEIRNSARKEAKQMETMTNMSRPIQQHRFNNNTTVHSTNLHLSVGSGMKMLTNKFKIKSEHDRSGEIETILIQSDGVNHLTHTISKNKGVSTLAEELIDDKKSAIRKAIAGMHKKAVLENIGNEEVPQLTLMSRVTLMGHAARKTNIDKLQKNSDSEEYGEENNGFSDTKNFKEQPQKSEAQIEYEQAKIAEEKRKSERKRLKELKVAQKEEEQRKRRANQPVLSMEEMQIAIKKFYEQEDLMKQGLLNTEQSEFETQSNASPQTKSGFWQGARPHAVKTKFKEDEIYHADGRDTKGMFGASQQVSPQKNRKQSSVLKHYDNMNETHKSDIQVKVDGEPEVKDRYYWEIQAAKHKPPEMVSSTKTESQYSMNSSSITFLSTSPKALHNQKSGFQKSGFQSPSSP